MMATYPVRAGLAQVLDEFARRRKKSAAELAAQANISASQLSKLRSGDLRPTLGMIERLASVFAMFPNDPHDVENTKAELLFATYNPAPAVTRKKELLDVLTIEGELEEEEKVASGQEIWIYSRRLIETELPAIFKKVKANLQNGKRYRYFIHPEHALDVYTFRKKLQEKDPINKDDPGNQDETAVGDDACTIYVIPKEAFMFADNRMFIAILNARDEGAALRCFKTRKQAGTASPYSYIELDPSEGVEYRDFLQEMQAKAEDGAAGESTAGDGSPALPCLAEDYARWMVSTLAVSPGTAK